MGVASQVGVANSTSRSPLVVTGSLLWPHPIATWMGWGRGRSFCPPLPLLPLSRLPSDTEWCHILHLQTAPAKTATATAAAMQHHTIQTTPRLTTTWTRKDAATPTLLSLITPNTWRGLDSNTCSRACNTRNSTCNNCSSRVVWVLATPQPAPGFVATCHHRIQLNNNNNNNNNNNSSSCPGSSRDS